MSIQLEANTRHTSGTGACRRLRRLQRAIPAVIYGGGSEPHSISLAENKLVKAMENEAFYSSILDVAIEGNSSKAVIKAIQRHPANNRVLHIDFQRVKTGEKIAMTIPLNFIGGKESLGVKEGGIISQLLSSVDIQCLPKDLPEKIDVDISELAIDQTLHLSDLRLPEGVDIVALMTEGDHDQAIVSIHAKKTTEEEPEAIEVPDETTQQEEKDSESSDKNSK